MKFALVDGKTLEAQPGLTGVCRDCSAAMIARCGQHRIWHWAHTKAMVCDPWWEAETPWHRAWKNRFPADWQEISHLSETGEKHRADVKTAQNLVLEFQHSALSQDERKSREAFYGRLVWVVNGVRRKRDRSRFFASLRGPSPTYSVPTYSMIASESALLRDWSESLAPVYFDFGEVANAPPLISALWRLHPGSTSGVALLSPIVRGEFVTAHLQGEDIEAMFRHIIRRDAAHYRQVDAAQPNSALAFRGRPVRRRTPRF